MMLDNCSMNSISFKTSSTSLQAFIFCLGFISVTGILGNALVITCIVSSKKLQTSTNCFIMNLNIADLSVCSLCIPAEMYFLEYGSQAAYTRHSKICEATAVLVVGLLSVSIVTLAWISFNRYLLIVYGSATYRKFFNKRYIPVMISCSWLHPSSDLED